MFGQHDKPTNDHIPDTSIDGALADEPGDSTPVLAPGSDDNADDTTRQGGWQHPGKPLDDVLPPAGDNHHADHPAPSDDSFSSSPSDDQDSTRVGTNTNDLIDIKRQALGQLTPLVGHLDQTPEEKFRTTMMMIQASDNQALIQSAYEAAQNISDEKVRAQALLDIVNEINYFTQQSK